MPPIDYEKEYDNRGRVPEHEAIFAGMDRDAAAYRAASPKAELGISYGPSARQIIDFFPAAARERAARRVHSWRLLALARSVELQPFRKDPERQRHRRSPSPATICARR